MKEPFTLSPLTASAVRTPMPLAHAQELRETARAAFAHYDADASGTVDAGELRSLVADLGGYLTDKELHAALTSLDRNQNGVIDEDEFVAWWTAQGGDLDGDGQVGDHERALERVKAFGQERFHVDIHSAAWRGKLDVVRRLIQNDAELANEVDSSDYGGGNTPLHYAVYQGHVEVCDALIAGGAKVNTTNSAGCTPLFLAAQQSRQIVVQKLLEHDADIRVPETEHKFTAVYVCSSDEILAAFRARAGGVPGVPDAPSVVRCEERSLVVEWAMPKDRHDQTAPVSGYKLKATSLPPTATAKPVSRSVLVGAFPTQCTINELEPNCEYAVQIAAINLHGISAFSYVSALARTRPARPHAPCQLRACSIDTSSIKLVWAAEECTSDGVKHFIVQQSIDDTADLWKSVATVDATDTRCVVSNLFDGRKYRFRVAAVSASCGQSDFSSSVSTRTQTHSGSSRSSGGGSESSRLPVTPRGARKPSNDLRGVVNAAHQLNGGNPVAALRYPSPRDAVELACKPKPRLLALVQKGQNKAIAKAEQKKESKADEKEEASRGRRNEAPGVMADAKSKKSDRDGRNTHDSKCTAPTRRRDSGSEEEEDYVYYSDEDDDDGDS